VAPGSGPRVATSADAAAVAEILTAAFHDDPVWGGWSFPDSGRRAAQHLLYWRMFVDEALPHGWVWLSAEGGAVALWIPPGCPEISPEVEDRLEPFLTDLVGAEETELLLETYERFEGAHPTDEPHYYLSLLGTHAEQRGKGIGMGLLADNLAALDAIGAAAYLESTNPDNNPRYERHGFVQVGEFDLPGEDSPTVATMWREPRG